MYSLIVTGTWKTLLRREAPALGLSIVIAELLFKFHSFTLECFAFLATWFALGWLLSRVARALPNAAE